MALSPLFTGIDHDEIARLSRTHDAAVRTTARLDGASFADFYAASVRSRGSVNRFLSDDRFHPSDAGHAVLASALAPVLLRALER
jgi:lysophospholipase L1-like esterase